MILLIRFLIFLIFLDKVYLIFSSEIPLKLNQGNFSTLAFFLFEAVCKRVHTTLLNSLTILRGIELFIRNVLIKGTGCK